MRNLLTILALAWATIATPQTADTVVVWNSDMPETRQWAEAYASDHPGAQVIQWAFGDDATATTSEVVSFRNAYRYIPAKAVVLAFQTPSHCEVGEGLLDPIDDAIQYAPIDYGYDTNWDCFLWSGFKPQRSAPASVKAPVWLDLGLLCKWIPENVGRIDLEPGGYYKLYQVDRFTLPRRNFIFSGNFAEVQVRSGGVGIQTETPIDQTDANGMTHYKYVIENVLISGGDIGIRLCATNHADIRNVELNGQRVAVQTEMALSTTFEHVKATHPKEIGFQFTYGEWDRGGRFKAPTNKVRMEFCEVYMDNDKTGVGVAVDNVEGFSMSDCSIQGSGTLHDIFVTGNNCGKTYTLDADTAAATNSVIKHCSIERVHLEGHYARKGAIYVNMPWFTTTELKQIMYHGSNGMLLVYVNGQVVYDLIGWAPPSGNLRTRVEEPRIRFISSHKDFKNKLPIQNLSRIDGGTKISEARVEYVHTNF